MFGGNEGLFFLTLALIGASVIDDIRSRKVHNSLVISIFIVAAWAAIQQAGASAALAVGTSLIAAFAFCLPLYLMKAVGGGDFKLMMALSPLLGWADLGWTLVFSLVWAVILGLIMIVLRKEVSSFANNLGSIALRNPVGQKELHKIPYTVAILFGFLTQFSLVERGVSLL